MTLVGPLTENERKRIAEEQNWQDMFWTTWTIVLEKAGMDIRTMQAIDPKDWQMDREDASWALERMMETEPSKMMRGRILLAWMDKGPGAK